jgi:hypothetical protein
MGGHNRWDPIGKGHPAGDKPKPLSQDPPGTGPIPGCRSYAVSNFQISVQADSHKEIKGGTGDGKPKLLGQLGRGLGLMVTWPNSSPLNCCKETVIPGLVLKNRREKPPGLAERLICEALLHDLIQHRRCALGIVGITQILRRDRMCAHREGGLKELGYAST